MNIRNFEQEDIKGAEEIFSMYWTDPEFLRELSEGLSAYIGDTRGNYGFIVAEEDHEIVGIAGYREIPGYLKMFSGTDKPVELYVIASRYRGRGIGRELKSWLINMAKEAGFSEMLLFSPESHKESWNFHDTLDFKRVGEVVPPEDTLGYVWSKVL